MDPYIARLAKRLAKDKPELYEDLVQEGEIAKFKYDQKTTDIVKSHQRRTIKTAMIHYLQKEDTHDKVVEWGQIYNDVVITENMVEDMCGEVELFKLFNQRELQIAMSLMSGFTESEIAKWMDVTQQRIDQIKSKIKEKLGKELYAVYKCNQ